MVLKMVLVFVVMYKETLSTINQTTRKNLRVNNNFLKLNLNKIKSKLESLCECRHDESVCILSNNKEPEKYTIFFENLKIIKSYKIKKNEFDFSNMVCDPYKTLRRGQNQKILSFYIYKKQIRKKDFQLKIDRIKKLMATAKKYFPEWTIRIYHNDDIDESIICELECFLNNETGRPFDNIDFCNIKNLPQESINLEHLEAPLWRLLPIGDKFVEILLLTSDFNIYFDNNKHLAVKNSFSNNSILNIWKGKHF